MKQRDDLDRLLEEIQSDPDTNLCAETHNQLHGAKSYHPWGQGKPLEERVLQARLAVAGRQVNANYKHRLERI